METVTNQKETMELGNGTKQENNRTNCINNWQGKKGDHKTLSNTELTMPWSPEKSQAWQAGKQVSGQTWMKKKKHETELNKDMNHANRCTEKQEEE